MRVVRCQECDVVLAHGVRCWFAVLCCRELVKDVANGHCRVPSCWWWNCWRCNFEGFVNMLVKCVLARSVYVLPRFKVILHHCIFSIDGGLLLLRVWHCYSIWIEFVWVCWCRCAGAMLRWKAVGSIKLYISGDITAPTHPFTGDWGHGISLSAFAK